MVAVAALSPGVYAGGSLDLCAVSTGLYIGGASRPHGNGPDIWDWGTSMLCLCKVECNAQGDRIVIICGRPGYIHTLEVS